MNLDRPSILVLPKASGKAALLSTCYSAATQRHPSLRLSVVACVPLLRPLRESRPAANAVIVIPIRRQLPPLLPSKGRSSVVTHIVEPPVSVILVAHATTTTTVLGATA